MTRKQAIGALAVAAGALWIGWQVVEVHRSERLPLLTETELNAVIAQMQADGRARCVEMVRKHAPEHPDLLADCAR